MKKAIIIYWTNTKNTEKVALSIEKGLIQGGLDVTIKKVGEAEEEDFYNYDLVCFGVPSYNWHIPKPADEFLKRKFSQYKKDGKIIVNAPKIQGKSALVFCTYSGPHTGIREAVPVGKYVGQFFEHFGFSVVDEWYVLSEFIGSEECSTLGRMGNIKGLPSKDDLLRIEASALNLSARL